jgi:4-hydroxy-3-methylbut-2-enyl diphosphate reductase
MRIRIDVDDKSGFCTGVIKAVKAAEKHIESEGRLCSLGELVHNPEEVRRLGQMGLEPITYDEFDKLQDITVLIRAHGEPPETFRKAAEKNINLIDATCPIVRNLQRKILDSYNTTGGRKGKILIFGKSNHPEVRALVGQTGGDAIVVRDAAELQELELLPPVYLFSQTTMKLGEYDEFKDALKDRMRELGLDPGRDLRIHDTICRQVSSREKYLENFVRQYDLVLFVSGKESSNGRALFRVCKEANENTHFISKPEESDPVELDGIRSIGICGATSTPGWLLSDVKKRLKQRLDLSES